MPKIKDRISINSPVNTDNSFRFIMSRTFASKFQSILSFEREKENIPTGSDMEIFFSQDTSIWLKSSRPEEYHFDISTDSSDLIIHFLAKVPEIRQIYLLKESENIFYVWSVVSEKTNAVKKSIYQCERNLIHYFKESLYFDFFIGVSSDTEYIRSAGAFLIFERK